MANRIVTELPWGLGWCSLRLMYKHSMKSTGLLATHTTRNSPLEAVQEVVMNPSPYWTLCLTLRFKRSVSSLNSILEYHSDGPRKLGFEFFSFDIGAKQHYWKPNSKISKDYNTQLSLKYKSSPNFRPSKIIQLSISQPQIATVVIVVAFMQVPQLP